MLYRLVSTILNNLQAFRETVKPDQTLKMASITSPQQVVPQYKLYNSWQICYLRETSKGNPKNST